MELRAGAALFSTHGCPEILVCLLEEGVGPGSDCVRLHPKGLLCLISGVAALRLLWSFPLGLNAGWPLFRGCPLEVEGGPRPSL